MKCLWIIELSGITEVLRIWNKKRGKGGRLLSLFQRSTFFVWREHVECTTDSIFMSENWGKAALRTICRFIGLLQLFSPIQLHMQIYCSLIFIITVLRLKYIIITKAVWSALTTGEIKYQLTNIKFFSSI